MKLITFTVPCYNSAAYMDHCIETLLTAGEDAEIILVDDGSKDDTGKIADAYAEKYPTIVRVIHQENGGHGEGVNQGIRNATGVYFKVVDSDDWLDTDALQQVLAELRAHLNDEQPLDLMMANYVYEHVADNTRNIVDYKGILCDSYYSGLANDDPAIEDAGMILVAIANRTNVPIAEIDRQMAPYLRDQESLEMLHLLMTSDISMIPGTRCLKDDYYEKVIPDIVLGKQTPKQALDAVAKAVQAEVDEFYMN